MDLLTLLLDLPSGADESVDFCQPFFTEQIITYLGNKRSLLPFINQGISKVKKHLGKNKLVCFDGFMGSGVVSRLMKYHSSALYSNDLESYSRIVNECYLANRSSIDIKKIQQNIISLNKKAVNEIRNGFIYSNYAPKDDNNIKVGERVFYTAYNAMILDTLKELIYSTISESERSYYLAPLIVAASINANTSGVFKGFHKKNGIGHFGGAGENALTRIKKKIELSTPIFSDVECEVNISQEDTNQLVKTGINFDLAYYDPPYNQHPYGSNYFMLNILATPEKSIPIQNGVSGIAENWNRSAYNKQLLAAQAMDDLIKNTDASYILISYNNEGIIPFQSLHAMLEKYGKVEIMEQDYNTYRGSRNLNGRNIKVKEFLWLLEKK